MRDYEENICKGCGAVERDFNFWMPLNIVEKAGTKQMRVGGIASDEQSPDLQGEKVFVDGLETDYLLERGAFNWNHGKEPGDILGEIDQVNKSGGRLYVEGFLYPHSKQAVDTYNLMRSMKDAGSKRKLGLSIEGKIKERNGKEVRKAWLKAVAMTYNPINQGSWVDILKSLEGHTFSKCNGDCSHCKFMEVGKAQSSIIDARTDNLDSKPATPQEQEEMQKKVCPKCSKPYIGDSCPCDPREKTPEVNSVNAGTESVIQEPDVTKSDKAVKEIIDLLSENPSPPDKAIHDLADRLGIAHDKFESSVYSILGEIINRGKGVDPDTKELEMGIEVEKEHTKYPEVARFIALTHLKELPDYYTKLKEMEAKKTVNEGDLEKQMASESSGMAAGYDIAGASGGVSGSALREENLDKKKKVVTYDERHLGIKKFTKKDIKDMVKAWGYENDEVAEHLSDLIFKAAVRVKQHPMRTKHGLAIRHAHERQVPVGVEQLKYPYGEADMEHEYKRINTMSDKALEARARKITDPYKLQNFYRAAQTSGLSQYILSVIAQQGPRLGVNLATEYHGVGSTFNIEPAVEVKPRAVDVVGNLKAVAETIKTAAKPRKEPTSVGPNFTPQGIELLATNKAEESFTEDAKKTMPLEERKETGLGIAVAQWSDWDGDKIMRIFKVAFTHQHNNVGLAAWNYAEAITTLGEQSKAKKAAVLVLKMLKKNQFDQEVTLNEMHFGRAVAQWAQDTNKLLRIFAHALEDANFHSDAAPIFDGPAFGKPGKIPKSGKKDKIAALEVAREKIKAGKFTTADGQKLINTLTGATGRVVEREGEVAEPAGDYGKVKFGYEKMRALINSDAFLGTMFANRKVHSPDTTDEHFAQVMFNTYVVGDSVMERRYGSIKKSWPEAKTKGTLGHTLTELSHSGQSKVRSHPRYNGKHQRISIVKEHPRINKKGKDGYSRLKDMLKKVRGRKSSVT